MSLLRSIARTIAVVAALTFTQPAYGIESLKSDDYRLHCNQGPGTVFAVIEYKGSFIGFDRMGHVSIARTKGDTPTIVGIWQAVPNTSDIRIMSGDRQLDITGLNARKCDTHWTFN